MEDISAPEEQEKKRLTDWQVFTQIWIRPRQIFRYINEAEYNKYVIPFLILAGISRAFDRASLQNMGDERNLGEIIISAVLSGGLLGWIIFYIYAAFLSFTGKWLKGQANTYSILRTIAYAMFPNILALSLLILQLAVYGNDIFKSDENTGSGNSILIISSSILAVILNIYTIILCVIGISEVQRIPVWKAIINLLLPGTIIIATILILIGMTKRL